MAGDLVSKLVESVLAGDLGTRTGLVLAGVLVIRSVLFLAGVLVTMLELALAGDSFITLILVFSGDLATKFESSLVLVFWELAEGLVTMFV